MANEFIRTDDYQWLRGGNGTYEMYQIVDMLTMKHPYFAGGGRFSLSDYEDDIDHCLKTFGYEGVDDVKRIYGNDWEQIVAECVFECNWADFDLESFDTEEEALAYVNKLMKED